MEDIEHKRLLGHPAGCPYQVPACEIGLMAHSMMPDPNTLTLSQVSELLGAEVLCGDNLAVSVKQVGAADLMSDVLALSRPGMLLMTGLLSTQVIRTAHVSDICAVVFVRGKKPGAEILALAEKLGIPVLRTNLTLFEASGLIYNALSSR
jgi:predicted transcriptional regulator